MPKESERRESSPEGQRELIIITKPHDSRLESSTASTVAFGESMTAMLERFGASAQLVFTASNGTTAPSRMESARSTARPDFHRVIAPDEKLDAIAKNLIQLPEVDAAYVKPPTVPAQINNMLPTASQPPSITPDFQSRQGYLAPAPRGVDAQFGWSQQGGRGEGISIVDVEGGWCLDHEDLIGNSYGLLAGQSSNDSAWRNHGTAVLGVFRGNDNNLGVLGICPAAKIGVVSIFGLGSAAAIQIAANSLNSGDILLIELHRPGPMYNYSSQANQQGYIAVEWWPDDFAAIQYAVSRGVIVVEAAGNGAQDLDDYLYDTPDTGFPPNWSNPFRRKSGYDSGAIVIGAGAPPVGTHGSNHGPDRSRLDFSNFGALVDAQGWGREVTTCGYGDLQAGKEQVWYTDRFSGTSSASPVVVGALGAVQGILKKLGQPLLTPSRARSLLRRTGSRQTNAPGRPKSQRIGNRPNIKALITAAKPKTGST